MVRLFLLVLAVSQFAFTQTFTYKAIDIPGATRPKSVVSTSYPAKSWDITKPRLVRRPIFNSPTAPLTDSKSQTG